MGRASCLLRTALSAALAAVSAMTASAAEGARVPGAGLACNFATASIDGRAAFDSPLRALALPMAGRDDLAVLVVEGRGMRLAAVAREGVWLSLRTEPDIDHANRVTVLDVAQSGPRAGLAVLVVSEPGSAAKIVTREGACTTLPAPEVAE